MLGQKMNASPVKRRAAHVLMFLENVPYSLDGRVRREVTALTRAGLEVSVICPRASYEARKLVLDGAHIYQYTPAEFGSGAIGYMIEYAHAMLASWLLSLYVLAKRGFYVIHAHNPPDFFVAIALFYRLLGKKFVFDHHDLAPEMFRVRFQGKGSVLHRILVIFERLSYRAANHVIVTNQSFKEIGIARSGIPADRITIVRNGPEPRHFADVEPHPSLRDCQQTVIGFLGAMGALDGVDNLLRALQHLRDGLGRRDWVCVLVGDGETFDDLTQLAKHLGIEEHTVFVGAVGLGEVVPYIAAMDICTAPDPENEYTTRCTLIKVMEYMAQSKPIVSFDLTETRFTAGESAIYVSDNDCRAFAHALEKLMDDPQRRRAMGEFGRHRVESGLSWKHSIPQLLSVYERLGLLEPQAARDEEWSPDTNDAMFEWTS